MKKLRNIFIILFIIIFIMGNTISRAATKITKKDLETAVDNFLKLSEEDKTNNEGINPVGFEITDDTITIKWEENNVPKEYSMKYDLTDKPKFISEAKFSNGMSYDEYEEKNSILTLPMFGYMLLANIKGVEYIDSAMYILMNMMSSAFSGDMSQSNYYIYDDTNTSTASIEGKTAIKKSEFGNYVMDYINDAYKNGSDFKDEDEINSFVWNTEKKDVTTDSCTIVSTLTVDTDAKFSGLKGYSDKFANSLKQENNKNNDESSKETKNNVKAVKDTKANIKSIPKSGVEFGLKNILQIIILISAVSICVILVRSKKEQK